VDDPKAMLSLARYEQYDAFTFGHSIRVCFLALDFARTMTQDEALLQRIGLAALLHDVGKAWVPFEILHAKGRLSPEERAEMERHTTYGAEILLGAEACDPLAVATAFGHHRMRQGGGYPRTIHEARQSTVLKIVKICDVYEALTAVRPYKPRMSPTRAYRLMLSMEGHFDRALLRHFISTNGFYPTGGRVRLSTGDTARVSRQTADPCRPVVDIEVMRDGEIVAQTGLAADLTTTRDISITEHVLDAEM
jgi:HD-GYP domain-containing protein (c-di-GMP phosphodiesterase class II)